MANFEQCTSAQRGGRDRQLGVRHLGSVKEYQDSKQEPTSTENDETGVKPDKISGLLGAEDTYRLGVVCQFEQKTEINRASGRVLMLPENRVLADTRGRFGSKTRSHLAAGREDQRN